MTTGEQKKEYRKKYRKDTYDFLKSHNMCVRCGSKDAYTMRGRTVCAKCTEKQKEYHRTNIEYFRQSVRDRYNKLKAEHKCTTCGVQLPNDRKATECEKCTLKRTHRREKRKKLKAKIKSRGLGNICYKCNKNEKMDGKKLCVSCYEKSMKALAKAQEVRKAKGLNECWQRDNQMAFSKGEQK